MDWIKVLHLFFLIAWIGQLFASGFLLVFSEKTLSFFVSDWRKYYQTVYLKWQLPSMICALFFGLILLLKPYPFFKQGWFHAKITGALVLVSLDAMLASKMRSNRSVKWIFCLSIATVLAILSVIYQMRNKEEEWRKKYIEEQQLKQ